MLALLFETVVSLANDIPIKMAKNQTNEVEAVMKKLMENKGVSEYLICNSDGISIKSTMDHKKAVQYCALVNGLVQKSQAALSTLLDPSESTAEYLRLRTNKREIIIAPGKDYTVVVVQESQNNDATPSENKDDKGEK